jgi:acetyl esterase/lipase
MPSDILTLPAPAADLRLSYGDDPNQFIDFRFPPRSASSPPLVVHIHGGFWRNSVDLLHAGHVCAALTGGGVVTANIEYRRVGDEGGGWPGTLDDALRALRFARVRTAGLGCSGRIVVTGHSAGGHLALWLAAEEPELDGVVALAPVACLRQAWELRLGGGAVEELLRASPDDAPERYAAACPAARSAVAPRVLIYGSADDTVPVSLGRAYVEARAQDPGPVSLIEVEGAGHSDLIDPRSAAWGTVEDTIRRLLSGG